MTETPQNNSRERSSRRLALTLWAGADKLLPMLYGVALIVIPLRLLPPSEWGTWSVFQVIFLVISLLGDFFLLQPMVKLASEHEAEQRPVYTAASVLYLSFSLVLALPVALAPEVFADLLKTDVAGVIAFRWMLWTVLATILRNIAIRVLQVDYRIQGIFLVDLGYFGGFISLMIIGAVSGELTGALDLIRYNVLALSTSSIVGFVLCARQLLPQFDGFSRSARGIVAIGTHQGGTGVLTIVQQQADVAIVSGTRGIVAAGIYNVARTFYRFYEALRDAGQLLLVPVTSNAYSKGDTKTVEEITTLATAALVLLLYPLTALLIIGAPILMPAVLPQYGSAVDEFQWLMATGFAMPFVIVPSAVLLGIGHTRDLFTGMLVGTGVILIGGVILTWLFGAIGMAAAVLLGTLVIAGVLTGRMNVHVHFTYRAVLRRSRSFIPMLRRRLAQVITAYRGGLAEPIDPVIEENPKKG